MSAPTFALTPVSGPPARAERAGGPGRPSPYAEILLAVKAQGVNGQWYQITTDPLDTEEGSLKAQGAAQRIRQGIKTAGIEPGEIDARHGTHLDGTFGHVFVRYAGQEGIQAALEAEAKRAVQKAERERREAAKQAAVAATLADTAAKVEAAQASAW